MSNISVPKMLFYSFSSSLLGGSMLSPKGKVHMGLGPSGTVWAPRTQAELAPVHSSDADPKALALQVHPRQGTLQNVLTWLFSRSCLLPLAEGTPSPAAWLGTVRFCGASSRPSSVFPSLPHRVC